MYKTTKLTIFSQYLLSFTMYILYTYIYAQASLKINNETAD